MRDVLTFWTTASFPTGLTVTIHGAKFQCTKCGEWKPASAFGLLHDRKSNAIRNQPQCKGCR